jgi:UTP--glucose-1-phosphate uridylyltransferase
MNKTPQKAVIPCAGFGTRFLPVTKVVPKELLPVGRHPAIHYVVEELIAANIRELVLVCNRAKTSVADYFLHNELLTNFLKRHGKEEDLEALERTEKSVTIQVVYQNTPRGLGDAVGCAKWVTGNDPFLVVLPDDLIFPQGTASLRLVELCRQRGGWGLLLERVPREKISSYGIIRGRETEPGIFRVEGAVEKPSASQAPSDLAIIGRYLFPSEIYACLSRSEEPDKEVQLTDALDRLAKLQPGWGILCDGKRFDVGTPPGLLQASRFVEQ